MQTSIRPNVRAMSRQDLCMVLDWAATEGWNPGLMDAEPFFAADPKGFFLAEQDGEAVGSISAVAYGDTFGFVGIYIVRADRRGRGYGRVLFQAALDYLDGRTIGLDGVPAQQENYRRQGFGFAYRTVRYEGTSGLGTPCAAKAPDHFVDLRSVQLHGLAAYDAQVFPTMRPRFLEAWVRQSGTIALGIVQLGQLAGYGVLRPCRVGYKIGPLLANDECLAETLFEGLLAAVPGETVFLDVPHPNQAATNLATRHRMKPVFETARMYRGVPPVADLKRTFGVTTLELG